MATTARITPQTTAALYTASIAAGSVGNFAAFDLAAGESIKILIPNAAGVYKPWRYIDDGGKSREAVLTREANTRQLAGPVDFRFDKPDTDAAVELSQYT